MPPRPAKGRAAQSFVAARGAPDSLEMFLGGMTMSTHSGAEDASMLSMNLKLLLKNNEITLLKALAELNRLVAAVSEEELISYMSNIIESVLRHAEHPNASVRAGVFNLLQNIVQRGKALQRELARGLPLLGVVWVSRMNDMEASVRNESREAFKAAFPPEVLHKAADVIVDGLIETFQTMVEQSHGKPLQDDNLDRRSNKFYSLFCGMGYMMRQPVSAREKIILFVENGSLQPFLPLCEGNVKNSLVGKAPLVRSAPLSLLRDILEAKLATPKIHRCVSTALHYAMFDDGAVVVRRAWELLLTWSAESPGNAIDFFDDDFLHDVMGSVTRCRDAEVAEVIFPSLVPWLVPLTRDARCVDTAAEFGDVLVQKLDSLSDVTLHEWQLVLSALLQLWELVCVRAAKRGEEHEQDGSKLFHRILTTLVSAMRTTGKRASYLDTTVSVVAASMRRAARHNGCFHDCLLVFCGHHPDARFHVASDDANGALKNTFDILQSRIVGSLLSIPGVVDEAEKLILKYTHDKLWDLLVILLRASRSVKDSSGGDGAAFTPSKTVQVQVAQSLLDAIQRDTTTTRKKGQDDGDEEEEKAKSLPLFKELLSFVLLWDDSEVREKLQTLAVTTASDGLEWVKDVILLDDMRSSDRLLALVLRACEEADFATLCRCVGALEKMRDKMSSSETTQMRHAVQHSLKAILGIVVNEDELKEGKTETESHANSQRKLAHARNNDEDSSSSSYDDNDEKEEEEEEEVVNRAEEVLQRLLAWSELLQKGEPLSRLLNITHEDFILPTLFRIVATVSPRLHAEHYMSIKAIRVCLQDEKNPLLQAMSRKKHSLGVNQFNTLVETLGELMDSYDVSVEKRDTASLELFDEVMRDPSCALAACGQLSRMLPFASCKLLQGIACSPELWREHQVRLREKGKSASDVPFAMMDFYCSLDGMNLSMLHCVRMAQLVHLIGFSVPIETFDAVAVMHPLLYAARMQEALSDSIRKLLMNKLLPRSLLRLKSRQEVLALLAASDTEPHYLLCTLGAVIRDVAVTAGDTILENSRCIASCVTEWIINAFLLKEGEAPVHEEAIKAYRAFFASLDETADVIGDSILLSIPSRQTSAVQEAMCMLPALPLPAALLTMTIHRHLSTSPVVVGGTVQQIITYSQRQRPLDGLEILAELSSSRIVDTTAYNNVVHAISHLLARCCRLRHMPPNGRLLSQAPNEAPMSLNDIRRVVVSAVSARRGSILHGRIDDVLRSSINLILFDAVAECVVSLHQMKEEDVPPVTKLIAYTSKCLSYLVTSDVSVLRSSEVTVTKVASVMNFSYQWLYATPIAKLESIGMDTVASAVRAVSLLSLLTLMRSGVVLLPIMRQITSKRSLKNLRNEFSATSPAKAKLFTRYMSIIMKTNKQKLLLFPHLLAWCVTLSGSVHVEVREERRIEVFHLLDLLCSLLLTPVSSGNKRLDGTYLCSPAKAGCDCLGFETVALTRPNSVESMKELAKGAASVFSLLLQSNTLSAVKSWLETIERKLQDIFYMFVEEHVSSLLIQESLLTILGKSPTGEPTFDVNENYNITVSVPRKLITLKYTMEDASVMVQIEFPNAFPLKPPVVTYESGKGCGVSTEKWRSWMLKMTTLLFGGSANVWDCVTLFGRNMDAHFSGQEPCPICFGVVSAVSCRLPDMRCAVCCNAAIHSDCLYTWWANSGQTVCPLCRSPWVAS